MCGSTKNPCGRKGEKSPAKTENLQSALKLRPRKLDVHFLGTIQPSRSLARNNHQHSPPQSQVRVDSDIHEFITPFSRFSRERESSVVEMAINLRLSNIPPITKA